MTWSNGPRAHAVEPEVFSTPCRRKDCYGLEADA